MAVINISVRSATWRLMFFRHSYLNTAISHITWQADCVTFAQSQASCVTTNAKPSCLFTRTQNSFPHMSCIIILFFVFHPLLPRGICLVRMIKFDFLLDLGCERLCYKQSFLKRQQFLCQILLSVISVGRDKFSFFFIPLCFKGAQICVISSLLSVSDGFHIRQPQQRDGLPDS